MLEGVLERLRVWGGELEHRLRADRSHSDFGYSLRHRLFEVIHVRKASDAAADHLGAGQQRAQTHEFGRNEFPLDRHHVAQQPDVQPAVVGQAAQQRHGRVGVSVDQARDEGLAATVDDLIRLVGSEDLVGWPDRQDLILLNRHGPVGEYPELVVHGDDVGMR